jgi:hypothetical protein
MTELQLYQWITENNIEWHRFDDDVWIMPYDFQFESFCDLLRDSYIFDEQPLDIKFRVGLNYSYLIIPMQYICDYFEIEIENVFKND